MTSSNSVRSIKHTVRLNYEEDQSFKVKVKESGLDKSEYMREHILNPCGGKGTNDTRGDDGEKKPPSSTLFMSKEAMESQNKGIGGLIMLAYVLYQIFDKEKKK